MSKRRPSGDGMIRKRADGRWEGRIVIGHKQDRSPIFRYFSAKTQRDLMEKLAQNKQEFEGVDLREDCTMPLESWLDQWLEEYAAPAIRPSTYQGYKNDLEKYLKPALGNIPVCRLTREQVQKFYGELLEHGRLRPDKDGNRGLSPSTVRSLHGVLHQAMDCALRERLCAANPTEGVVLPKKETAEMKILNDEQLERFMESIRDDDTWHDFFYTEITTGLRLGEICGLRWEDMDWEKGILRVRRSVRKENGRIVVGETKTAQGRRDIELPPSTVELLRRRKADGFTEAWIFPDGFDTKSPMHPEKVYRKLKEILQKNDLPNLRFHDLRHTFATHALSSGVDPKTLSGLLGHSKASFTLDTYTHVTQDMQRKAADIVGGFLEELMA